MAELEPERSLAARKAAELALVRVCHHYGGRPEFVLIGGLVPGLLCSDASVHHAGTTDVDVQVNLEIAGGAVNAARLEHALRNAEFSPSAENVWRWKSTPIDGAIAVIKFEQLADLDDEPQNATITFTGCTDLGAANLRGTGFAAQDVNVHRLTASDHGVRRDVEVNVTALAGFLLAKTAAAHGRHKAKDYYDIAFVLLHHNPGPDSPAARVLARFGVPAQMRTPLIDLQANFAGDATQGTEAYMLQMTQDHPEVPAEVAAADAQLAVTEFTRTLLTATS